MDRIILFSDNFIEITYHQNEKLLEAHWTSESENLSDEHFREINKMYIEFAEKNEITSFLLDTKKFLFGISVETQSWVGSEILPVLKNKGINKASFIVSQEFIAQLSIELTMEENPTLMEVKYFDNEKDAKDWLLK